LKNNNNNNNNNTCNSGDGDNKNRESKNKENKNKEKRPLSSKRSVKEILKEQELLLIKIESMKKIGFVGRTMLEAREREKKERMKRVETSGSLCTEKIIITKNGCNGERKKNVEKKNKKIFKKKCKLKKPQKENENIDFEIDADEYQYDKGILEFKKK
jgi:hypothetical protein